jgi:hypothetical protein
MAPLGYYKDCQYNAGQGALAFMLIKHLSHQFLAKNLVFFISLIVMFTCLVFTTGLALVISLSSVRIVFSGLDFASLDFNGLHFSGLFFARCLVVFTWLVVIITCGRVKLTKLTNFLVIFARRPRSSVSESISVPHLPHAA